jgi:DNA polymerase I-like protein with 3'-5' exonuclease and polymerase domains
LVSNQSLPEGAREFAQVITELGKGANDAHWLGKVTETEDGIDFDKVGDDGFIHPRYDICGSPDRAIASGPNIQNFVRPKDDPRPVPLRAAVIPFQEDHILLSVDYSAVETITNAYESHDMDRVIATLDKQITHEGTAAIVNSAFGLSLTRQEGKAVNHGIDKGESPYNLARTLFKVDRPSRQQVLQCQQIVQKMLNQFPKTAQFRDQLWERSVHAKPAAHAETVGNMRLHF